MNPEPLNSLSLSLVIPAHNEEKNLSPTVEDLVRELDRLGIRDYEIIIVDDGSRDRTAALADELAARDDRVRVIHHPQNQGYGAALASGYRAATRERVFYTDADRQFDFTELGRLIALLPHADIVAGFRERKQYNLYRHFISAGFNLLTRLLFGLPDRDVNCSFKIYPRELFDRISLTSRDYFIDAEIAVKARRLGYRTVQVGVTHLPRREGKSNAAPPRFALLTLREMISAFTRTETKPPS